MLTKSEEKLIRNWEKTVQKGRLWHHLLHGISLAVLSYLITSLLDLDEKSFVEAFFSTRALYYFLSGFFIGAAILAPIEWWAMKGMYKRIKEKSEKN